jgi:hypothetical protein
MSDKPILTYFVCGRGKKPIQKKFKCVKCGEYFPSSEEFLKHRNKGCARV